MAYRTLNPWGHVSKADRLNRMRLQGKIHHYCKILNVEGGSDLFDELKKIHEKAEKDGVPSLSQEEKKRYNDICDELVKKGISEETIERAL